MTVVAKRCLLAVLMCAVLLMVGGLLPSFMLSLFTQCVAAMLILASLRVLVGMGGVISFGHALYVGMGAYATAHVMQWMQTHEVGLPLLLVPLAGGVAGGLTAIPAGWLSTRRSSPIYVAMVSLALCELVHALAQVWPAVFGDESGLQIDRTTGNFWGLNFADERWVLVLALIYAIVLLFALHQFVKTPLGKWLVATREDAVRVACLGMNPQRVQHLAFLISGFVAGVGGALLAIEFEAAHASMFGVARSGEYLMFAYLGGLGAMAGSVLGAVMAVLSTIWLPTLTQAAELYLGLIFVYAVLHWPDGLWGVWQARRGLWRALMWQGLLAHLCCMAGIVICVELLYRYWGAYAGLDFDMCHALWLISAVGLWAVGSVLLWRLKQCVGNIPTAQGDEQ